MRLLMFSVACLLSWLQSASAFTAGDVQALVTTACGCQVDVVIVNPADKTTWQLDFGAGVTAAQQSSAQAALTNFAPRPVSMQVTSTSTPALNASYPIDPLSQQKVQAISLYVAVNGKFPAGQVTQAWPDVTGAMHQFQTTAQWQAFATAIGDFVAALDIGRTPAQPVTIP